MTGSLISRLSLCVLWGCLLVSCASPRERRITGNPQLYQSLSTGDQVLVQQGRIREGMSKEAVFLALGRPDGIAAGRQKGASIEQWTYLGSQPVYTNTIGMGGGGGGGRPLGEAAGPFVAVDAATLGLGILTGVAWRQP